MSSGDLVKVWCTAVFHAVNRRRTDKVLVGELIKKYWSPNHLLAI